MVVVFAVLRTLQRRRIRVTEPFQCPVPKIDAISGTGR
jgi:hypothetical protein